MNMYEPADPMPADPIGQMAHTRAACPCMRCMPGSIDRHVCQSHGVSGIEDVPQEIGLGNASIQHDVFKG